MFIQPFSHETSHAIATGRIQSPDIINKIVWGVRLVTRDQLVLKNTNLKHAIVDLNLKLDQLITIA